MKFEGKFFSRLFFLPFIVLPPLLVWLMTRQGIGVFGDSLAYLRVAESLDVFSLTAFPPLYPFVLGVLARGFHISVESAAIVVNAVAFPLTIIIVLYGLRMFFPLRTFPLFVAGLALLLLHPMLLAHSWAFTEPLFLVSGSLCLVFLMSLTRDGYSHGRLIGAALAVAACLLNRYAGGAFVLYGVLVIFLLPAPLFSRGVRTSAFGSIAVTPLVLFKIIERIHMSEPKPLTGYKVNMGQISENMGRVMAEHIPQLLITVAEWFVPYRLIELFGYPVVGGGVFIGLFVVAVLSIRKLDRGRMAWSILIVWPFFYMAFAVSWMVLGGAHAGSLRHRQLVPSAFVLVPTMVMAASFLADRRSASRWVCHALIMLFVLFTGFRAVGYIQNAHRDGLGFATRAYRESDIMHYALTQTGGATLYSNARDVMVYYGVTNTILDLPRTLDQRSSIPFPEEHVERRLEAMRQAMRDGALLLHFQQAHPSAADFPPISDVHRRSRREASVDDRERIVRWCCLAV